MVRSTQDLFDLTARVAVVTGASSGIGRAAGTALCDAGAKVIAVARRDALLRSTVAEWRAAGGDAEFIAADLNRLDDIPELGARVAEPFGAPDILLSAAGVNLRESPEKVTLGSWNTTININLAAPLFLARELVPAMRARGWGRIINIASLQSRRAFADGIAYGASKGGVEQLTRAMAEAWSRDGVTCNALAPGFFPTELTAAVFSDPQREQQAARQTAIGRNGRMEDLYGPIVFFASAASDYVTGQTVFVDGGFTAK